MKEIIFDLQLFAEVLHGDSKVNNLRVTADKTQVYGLAGNDTLISSGKSEVLLIGGSGNDSLVMAGGNGTLSGGKGSDTFNLTYSASQKISAVIEDIDPTNDKIVIAYNGDTAPQLSSVVSGNDVIWTDSDGYFNLTLKGSNDARDYYDEEGNEYLWEVFRLVNVEREKENLPQLTMSQALSDGVAIRSVEIIENFEHVRPDGSNIYTALNESYNPKDENIASGQSDPNAVMYGDWGWMNSTGHRANILRSNFKKIGVGYYYYNDDPDYYKHYWVQMFSGNLTSPDTISTEDILKTEMEIITVAASVDTTPADTDSAEQKSISVKINGETFNVTLEDNATTRALKEILPLEVEMNELNGNEKYFYLDKDLPSNSASVKQIHAGDLMLFGSDCIVIFYKDFTTSYSYTRLGTIDNPDGLAEILGDGNVNVAFAESADDFIDDTNALTINDSIKSPLMLDANIKIADASKRKKAIKITGNALNNSIVGGSGKDSINGAEGNDTLNGGKGNDTLNGGAGADVFIYEKNSGKDVIDNYGEDDIISLGSGATIKDAYMSGKNAVIKVGSGSITIKNISANKVTFVQGDNETLFSNGVFIHEDSAKVLSSFKGTIDLDAYDVTTADASESKKSVTLQGGTSDDHLIGGKGKDKLYSNGGNDTLSGGKGNDSLWGGDDADTFIYSKGDGKDVIYNFADNDSLTLDKLDLKNGTLNSKGTELYLKVGSTSKAITLKNVTASSFNINGSAYHIENKKLVK